MEGPSEKIPYPKSVFIILGTVFCDSFSNYGIKAVLTIYLVNVMAYSPHNAIQSYHILFGFGYIISLLGALIADSILGKYKTILYLSVAYALGNVILALAATTPLKLPPESFSMIGLALIAIGTGGIKACVSAFGGDQFVRQQQERQLSTFFAIYYFTIHAGSLISTFITPIFRKDISCFESDTCYPLAFGVPAALMITALVILIAGKPWYRIPKLEGNIVMKIFGCIAHAISRKWTVSGTGDIREHFLDYADDRYAKHLIEDVKVLLRILVLYIPLPVFWALYYQQGSWILQATKMNGKVGGSLIYPDQILGVTTLLILTLIPLYDPVLYPILKKANLLLRPLQRLTVGGILAGIAFIMSGLLQLQLESTNAVQLASTESQVHFINTVPCNVNLSLSNEALGSRSIESLQMTILSKIEAGNYDGKIVLDTATGECDLLKNAPFSFVAEEQKAYTYTIQVINGSVQVTRDKTEDELEKSIDGNPKLKVLILGMLEEVELNATLLLVNSKTNKVVNEIDLIANASKVFEIEANEYNFHLSILDGRNGRKVIIPGSTDLLLGGNYILTLMKSPTSGEITISSYIITTPNSVHMLWILPQYIVITIAEVMFSITGLEFSYQQAPVSMKSIVQALWLLTSAVGGLLVVFVTFINFDSQAMEFFLFAELIFVDMVIFAILAYLYKPSANLNREEMEELNMTSNMSMQASNGNGFENAGFHKDQ